MHWAAPLSQGAYHVLEIVLRRETERTTRERLAKAANEANEYHTRIATALYLGVHDLEENTADEHRATVARIRALRGEQAAELKVRELIEMNYLYPKSLEQWLLGSAA